MIGWIFAFIYAGAFEGAGRATWWFGAAIGLIHSAFVLLVGMQALPSLHPRMASEQHGPTPTRQLQPPGILALHYGRRTPIAVVLSHLAYGAILRLLPAGLRTEVQLARSGPPVFARKMPLTTASNLSKFTGG